MTIKQAICIKRSNFARVHIAVLLSGLFFCAVVSPTSATDVRGKDTLFNLPSELEFEALLSASPMLVDLSEQERARQIHFAYQTLVLQAVLAEHDVRAACASEIDQHCAANDDSLSCLVDPGSTLGTCCSVFVRNTLGSAELDMPERHHGLVIPVGGRLAFDDATCGASIVELPHPVTYNGLSYGPGEMRFDEAGQLVSGDITPDRNVNGWWVAGGRLVAPMAGTERSLRLSRDSTVDGVTWAATSWPIELHANGRVARGLLAMPAMIGNAMWSTEDIITLNNSGVVTSGILAEPLALNGLLVPRGAKTELRDGRQLFSFQLPTSLSRPTIAIPSESHVAVDVQGRLVHVTLSEAVFRRGVLHPAHSTLEFDISGELLRDSMREDWNLFRTGGFNLQQIPDTLDAPTTIAGIELPIGSLVFHEDGEISEAIVPRALRHAGVTIGPGRVGFAREFARGGEVLIRVSSADIVVRQRYKALTIGAPERHYANFLSDSLSSTQLAADVVESGLHFASGAHVKLNANGTIRSAATSREGTRNGIVLPVDTLVLLNESGRLTEFTSHQPVTVSSGNGMKLVVDGEDVLLHDDGSLAECTLHAEAILSGTRYSAGTAIRLSAAGDVTESSFHRIRFPDGYPLPESANDSMSSYSGYERSRFPVDYGDINPFADY